MATVPYDHIHQPIQNSCLIIARPNDGFYFPTQVGHTGYAVDGFWYNTGAADVTKQASWFTEPQSTLRGPLAQFPSAGLCLLSRAALHVLDETTRELTLWMTFLFGNRYALADDFDQEIIGFLPSHVQYSNGVVGVTLTPDAGSDRQNNLFIHIDFVNDNVYMDTAQ